MSGGKDPEEYFIKLEELQQELKDLKVTIENDTLKGIVMAKLPMSYEPLRAVLDTMGDLDYDKVKQHVRGFYQRNLHASDEISSDQQALSAHFNGTCYKCDERGHKSFKCLEKRGKISCEHCGKTGHLKKQCWDLKDSEETHLAL